MRAIVTLYWSIQWRRGSRTVSAAAAAAGPSFVGLAAGRIGGCLFHDTALRGSRLLLVELTLFPLAVFFFKRFEDGAEPSSLSFGSSRCTPVPQSFPGLALFVQTPKRCLKQVRSGSFREAGSLEVLRCLCCALPLVLPLPFAFFGSGQSFAR